ncbi:hypothetical protein [Caballeronia sp. LZ001]|uniref:hypothetical protein n=1 Tax=Caballeronia sp. LZ001 TaxID=3038553 RepID=UPI002858FB2D|nr:hypothetical protein [Caballeronia sp. LZ001]MDR5803407.1 hypothetical protein [Caballeronia sp. LZ001]
MSKLHPAIKVASCQEGFRRAGYTFGIQPKTIALAALPPHAYAAIREDQSLVVVDTAISLDEDAAAALAHADAPHVIAAQASGGAFAAASALNAQRETLARLDASLTERAKQLAEQASELQQTSALLDAREAALSAREHQLLEREQALDARSNTRDPSRPNKAAGK